MLTLLVCSLNPCRALVLWRSPSASGSSESDTASTQSLENESDERQQQQQRARATARRSPLHSHSHSHSRRARAHLSSGSACSSGFGSGGEYLAEWHRETEPESDAPEPSDSRKLKPSLETCDIDIVDCTASHPSPRPPINGSTYERMDLFDSS